MRCFFIGHRSQICGVIEFCAVELIEVQAMPEPFMNFQFIIKVVEK